MKTISRYADNANNAKKASNAAQLVPYSKMIAKNMPDPANPKQRIVTLKKTEEVLQVSCHTNEVINKSQKLVEDILKKENSENTYESFIELACKINDLRK